MLRPPLNRFMKSNSQLHQRMHNPLPSPFPWLVRSVLLSTLLSLAHPGEARAAASTITAQWDFDQGDLRASVGKDLQYGDGPTGRVKNHTSFGTTTSVGIPDIGGKPAKVMKYTRDEFTPDATDQNPRGYIADHGIAPNGNGTKVNQFTMVVDMMIPDLHQGDAYNTVN